MAARHKLTAEKKEVIADLIEMYGIKSTVDLQGALKDLLGGTIQEMLSAEHIPEYFVQFRCAHNLVAGEKVQHIRRVLEVIQRLGIL